MRHLIHSLSLCHVAWSRTYGWSGSSWSCRLSFLFWFCCVAWTLLCWTLLHLASRHRLCPVINPASFWHLETFLVGLHGNLVNGQNIDLFSCCFKMACNPQCLDLLKAPSNMGTMGEAPIKINRLPLQSRSDAGMHQWNTSSERGSQATKQETGQITEPDSWGVWLKS